MAGADYRMGRESYYEAFEPSAPFIADNHKMGTTLLWRSKEENQGSSFPLLPWAAQMSKEYFIDGERGRWWWESGFKFDTVEDAEYIRDNLLRAIYGNWSYLKNNVDKYRNLKLEYIPYISGKRESRRLLGDIILNENDLLKQIDYPDKSYTTTGRLICIMKKKITANISPGTNGFHTVISPRCLPLIMFPTGHYTRVI